MEVILRLIWLKLVVLVVIFECNFIGWIGLGSSVG